MSSSHGLGGRGLAGCRRGVPTPYVCPRCRPLAQRLLTSLVHAPGLRRRNLMGQLGRIGPGRRGFHSSKSNYLPSMSVLLDDNSREAFAAELNRKQDIYSYLLQWQENPTAPNIDPIRPRELREPGASEKWVGNMLHESIMNQGDGEDMFEAEDDRYLKPGDYEGAPFLQPGDLILLKAGDHAVDASLAIYVRTVDKQLHVYTWRGRWRAARNSDVVYLFNQRAPPELLAPIIPYFPKSAVEVAVLPQFALEGGVPRPLSAPLMSFMLEFEKAASEFHVKHAEILDDIYNVLAHHDQYLIMTLDQVIEKALKRDPESLKQAEKYAVHKALQRQQAYIINNQAASTVESYRIRSKKQSALLDEVVRWARTSQEHAVASATRTRVINKGDVIKEFAEKAARLVRSSRKFREPTKSFALTPSSSSKKERAELGSVGYSKSPTEAFSPSDRSILHFLLLWILLPSKTVAESLNAAGAMILRATTLYEGYPHSQATGYLLLQELGILSPWENFHLLSEQLELPGHGFANEADRLSRECAKSHDNTLGDKMKHMRKDWGDLAVLCIDSAEAAEIDDGISVEPSEGSEDTFWIRVHVANPSAFIQPGDKVAEAAAHFKRSFYSVERVYPMLPPALTDSHFSLAPGRPTLTISAKVNMDGEILDTEVTNGRINNVTYTTPESVQKLFGIDSSWKPTVDLCVGDTRPPTKQEKKPEGNKNQLPEEFHEPLRILEKLLAARRERRVAKGAVDSASPRRAMPSVSVGNSTIPRWTMDFLRGNRYQGDPTIRLTHPTIDPFEQFESTKHDLVSHAMLLAGEVAGQWCMERGIPAVYSGTSFPPDEGVGQDQSGSTIPKSPLGFSVSKPTPHLALGMDQYVKCTSPLRRFTDLIAHWQIEAYLRDEKELPFSDDHIDTFIDRLNWQDRLKTRAESRSREFWICQLFHRALNSNDAKLPEIFQCLIVTDIGLVSGSRTAGLKTRYLATILPFHQRCIVEASPDAEGFKQGDLVDVKLTSVDVFNTLISGEGVRLVKRPEEGAIPLGYFYV